MSKKIIVVGRIGDEAMTIEVDTAAVIADLMGWDRVDAAPDIPGFKWVQAALDNLTIGREQ